MKIENLYLQEQIDELKLLQNNWLDKIYPIGSIYKTVSDVNPEEFFGGAWIPWGAGRVPVGIDANDDDFSTVEKIGGEKTHVLTTNEMPSHNHSINTANGQGNMEWGFRFSYDGHNSGYNGMLQQIGGGQSHNNLQPYIVWKTWKRVEPLFTIEWTDSSGSYSEILLPDYDKFTYGLNERIKEIVSGRSGWITDLKVSSNGIKIKSLQGVFSERYIRNIDVSDLDVSECKSLLQTFDCGNAGSGGASSINMLGWDTSNVTNMQGMFAGQTSLSSVDLSSFNTSNVTDMSSMFWWNRQLTTLDLSNFDTRNVTNMSSMFYLCRRLTNLDISGFDFSKVAYSNNMFLDVPSNCLITVKDQAAKNFVLSVRSDLTNVQIKS